VVCTFRRNGNSDNYQVQSAAPPEASGSCTEDCRDGQTCTGNNCTFQKVCPILSG
jgi:hypothetical protein